MLGIGEIRRDEFEEMIRPLVDRTVNLVEKAIGNAILTKDDIDFVLMIGNSTLVPLVQEAMVGLFGPDKVRRDVHPKHCVALGAAIIAAQTDGIACIHCGYVGSVEGFYCKKCGNEKREEISPHI